MHGIQGTGVVMAGNGIMTDNGTTTAQRDLLNHARHAGLSSLLPTAIEVAFPPGSDFTPLTHPDNLFGSHSQVVLMGEAHGEAASGRSYLLHYSDWFKQHPEVVVMHEGAMHGATKEDMERFGMDDVKRLLQHGLQVEGLETSPICWVEGRFGVLAKVPDKYKQGAIFQRELSAFIENLPGKLRGAGVPEPKIQQAVAAASDLKCATGDPKYAVAYGKIGTLIFNHSSPSEEARLLFNPEWAQNIAARAASGQRVFVVLGSAHVMTDATRPDGVGTSVGECLSRLTPGTVNSYTLHESEPAFAQADEPGSARGAMNLPCQHLQGERMPDSSGSEFSQDQWANHRNFCAVM